MIWAKAYDMGLIEINKCNPQRKGVLRGKGMFW